MAACDARLALSRVGFACGIHRSPDRPGDRLARMRAHALSPWLFRALLPPHSAPHRGVQTDGTPRRVSTMREPHCDH